MPTSAFRTIRAYSTTFTSSSSSSSSLLRPGIHGHVPVTSLPGRFVSSQSNDQITPTSSSPLSSRTSPTASVQPRDAKPGSTLTPSSRDEQGSDPETAAARTLSEFRPRQKMPLGLNRPLDWPFIKDNDVETSIASGSKPPSTHTPTLPQSADVASKPRIHSVPSPLPLRIPRSLSRSSPSPSSRIQLRSDVPPRLPPLSPPTFTSSTHALDRPPHFPSFPSSSLPPSFPSGSLPHPSPSSHSNSLPSPSPPLKPSPRSLLAHLITDPHLLTRQSGKLLAAYSGRIGDRSAVRDVLSRLGQERVSLPPAPPGYGRRGRGQVPAKVVGGVGNIAMMRRFPPMKTLSSPYTPRHFLRRLHFVLHRKIGPRALAVVQAGSSAKSPVPAQGLQPPSTVSLSETLAALRLASPPPHLQDEASALHLHLAYSSDPQSLLDQFASLSTARPGRQALHLSVLALLRSSPPTPTITSTPTLKSPPPSPPFLSPSLPNLTPDLNPIQPPDPRPNLDTILPFISDFHARFGSTPGRETWRHIARVATRYSHSQLGFVAWAGWKVEDARVRSRTSRAWEEIRTAAPDEVYRELLVRALAFLNPLDEEVGEADLPRESGIHLDHDFDSISSPSRITSSTSISSNIDIETPTTSIASRTPAAAASAAFAIDELMRFSRNGQDRARWARTVKKMIQRGWVRPGHTGDGSLQWVGKRGANKADKERWMKRRREKMGEGEVGGMRVEDEVKEERGGREEGQGEDDGRRNEERDQSQAEVEDGEVGQNSRI